MSMKNNLYAGLLTALFCHTTGFGAITILEDTPKKLTFRWSIEEPEVADVSRSGRRFTEVTMKTANVQLSGPGDALLPGYSFHVGVPPGLEPRVTLLSQSATTIRLEAPLRTKDEKEFGLPVGEYTSFSPWLLGPASHRFRYLQTRQYIICPLRYQAETQTMQVLLEGVCTVEFPDAPLFPVKREKSDYMQSVAAVVLNFSTATGWYESPVRMRSSLARRTAASSALSSGSLVHFTVGDGSADYNEATVEENGILKIRGSDIIEYFGSSVRATDVALYASPKGEMAELGIDSVPAFDSLDTGYREIPLLLLDSGDDGLYLNEDDLFLAYVTGTSDWEFDSTRLANNTWGIDFTFRLNRYSDVRHYWIGLKQGGAGLRMEPFVSQPGVYDTVTAFTNHIRFKKSYQLPWGGALNKDDIYVPIDDPGVDWIWRKLTPVSNSFSEEFTLPLYDASQPLTATLHNGEGNFGTTFHVDMANSALCTSCNFDQWYSIPPQSSQNRSIRTTISLNNASGNNFIELESIDFSYPVTMTLDSLHSLTVYSPPDSGIVTYRLGGTPREKTYLFRIPDNEQKISLIGTFSTGPVTWSDSTGAGIRYFACSESDITSLPLNRRFIPDIRDSSCRDGIPWIRKLRYPHTADYLIITHADFFEAAVELAVHKQTHRNMKPALVRIDDIYREFNGGSVDPTAVRNFLVSAYNTWQSLDYVVFLGNGHWDFKGHGTHEPNFIPTAQINNQCVEDYFAVVSESSTYKDEPNVIIGRIPCNTHDDAFAVVEKIKDLEDPSRSDPGSWRSRVLLVADDNRQGNLQDNIPHWEQSDEVLLSLLDQNPALDVTTVYLLDYERDANKEKPAASRAVLNAFSNGVACVNYFGHGSDALWADEHILATDNISSMHNAPRYPLVSSFSCSVGKFDKPDHTSLSDELVRYAGGGAAVTISSTRIAFAQSNKTLAKSFYSHLFETGRSFSIGQAYRAAMGQTHTSSLKSYALLGDPSIRFFNRTDSIALSVYDQNERPVNDTLQAMQRITVKGAIVDTGTGGLLSGFGSSSGSASVFVGLYNPMEIGTPRDQDDTTITYFRTGKPIFAGKTNCVNGRFEQTIQLPKNIAFGRDSVKLIAYAWEGDTVATGYSYDFRFFGTDTSGITDTLGPTISVRPVYRDPVRNAQAGMTDRISASLPLDCKIAVYDEGGVDVVNSGPDEGLTIEVPGVLSKRNINHAFQFEKGDFRNGTADINLEEELMQPGTYDLIVSARDLAGNISRLSVDLNVVSPDSLQLDRVFNFPNPMRMGQTTQFFFQHSTQELPWDNQTQVRLWIKIYSLSGKLVHVIDSRHTSGFGNGYSWDGRDADGFYLSPNIYLYQVIARKWYGSSYASSSNGTVVKSPVRKLVIHPPR